MLGMCDGVCTCIGVWGSERKTKDDKSRITLHKRGGKKTGDMLFGHITVVSRMQQDSGRERTDNTEYF